MNVIEPENVIFELDITQTLRRSLERLCLNLHFLSSFPKESEIWSKSHNVSDTVTPSLVTRGPQDGIKNYLNEMKNTVTCTALRRDLFGARSLLELHLKI